MPILPLDHPEPFAATLGVMLYPGTDEDERRKALAFAAQWLGEPLRRFYEAGYGFFDTAFARLAELRAEALVIGSDLFFTSHSERLAALTLRHAVPSIYQFREFTAAGGLMSYGGSFTDWGRQAGIHTGRVLAGAKPADLPVQQATLTLGPSKILRPPILARS